MSSVRTLDYTSKRLLDSCSTRCDQLTHSIVLARDNGIHSWLQRAFPKKNNIYFFNFLIACFVSEYPLLNSDLLYTTVPVLVLIITEGASEEAIEHTHTHTEG